MVMCCESDAWKATVQDDCNVLQNTGLQQYLTVTGLSPLQLVRYWARESLWSLLSRRDGRHGCPLLNRQLGEMSLFQ